jgi:serine O-acetyltransferase
MREIRSRHPKLREAVLADAQLALAHRAERHELGSRLDALAQVLRLIWVSDGFPAQLLYRIKARLQSLRVPVLPRIVHRLAIITGGVAIGDPVVVHPGVYLFHGQVVIDGLTEVGAGVVIAPFVTVGLRAGDMVGPTIERGVSIGTGAKVLGRVTVGAGATIGANAVVVDDVPPATTVIGAPARPVSGPSPPSDQAPGESAARAK